MKTKYCIIRLERKHLVPLTAKQARARLSQMVKKQNKSQKAFARSVVESHKSRIKTMIDKVTLRIRPESRKKDMHIISAQAGCAKSIAHMMAWRGESENEQENLVLRMSVCFWTWENE